jgi:hypothetical protein
VDLCVGQLAQRLVAFVARIWMLIVVTILNSCQPLTLFAIGCVSHAIE